MKSNSTLLSFGDNRPVNALADAQSIASFLQDVVSELCMGNGGGSISGDSAMGLVLVFDVLRDKLRIASGELVLPSSDKNDNQGGAA